MTTQQARRVSLVVRYRNRKAKSKAKAPKSVQVWITDADGARDGPQPHGRRMTQLKLALNTGYWAGGPPAGAPEAIAEAERLGFDSVWCSEAYGSDALTPLAWWGSRTERLRLGTAIVQLSARQPAATAMAAMTLDHLSGGRFILGIGASGAAGRRGLVRDAVREAARAHARVHRDPARHLGAAGTGHQRRARLSAAAARGPRRRRPRQAAEVLDPPAARGHPDLPRGRGAEERGDGRGAVRRLDGHAAQPARAVLRRRARRGLRARRRPPQRRGLRGRGDGPVHRPRRRRGGRRHGAPVLRPLLRWHGREGRQELPRQRRDPHGLRSGDHGDPGPLPRRQEGRGRRGDPLRADPEDVAARAGGQDPRTTSRRGRTPS